MVRGSDMQLVVCGVSAGAGESGCSRSEVLQLVRAHDARALVVAPHFGA